MLAALGTVAAVAFLAYAAYTFSRSRLGTPAPGAETLHASVCDVKEGGAIRLAAFGDDGEDVVLEVATLVIVRAGPEEWHELAGEYRARLVRLEWRKTAGATRVVAYSRTDLPLEEVGIDPVALDAARPGTAPLAALGTTFRLEEAGDAIRGGALAVRTWVLHDDEKRRVMRIERAGQQPPRACVGRVVAADAIEVVRLSR
jgi:hypothetical protein